MEALPAEWSQSFHCTSVASEPAEPPGDEATSEPLEPPGGELALEAVQPPGDEAARERVQPPGGEAGEEQVAWDWERMRARCLREARRFVRGHQEAEDAVQEALIRAWRKRDTCRAEDPMPWLLQITRREALRISRRTQQRPELDLESVPEEAAASFTDRLPDPEEVDVQVLLERLAPRDRALLVLRYEQDLTQPEVADRLGMPEGTVKVRLHRLRKRLRVELEPEQ